MTTNESLWMPIRGYEGVYEIHPDGLVRSVDRLVVRRWGEEVAKGKIRRHAVTGSGYCQIILCRNASRVRFSLHRLVAEHFIGPAPSDDHQINHIDGDPLNNLAANLEWVTRVENMQHANRLGRTRAAVNGKMAKKLTLNQVRAIRQRIGNGEPQGRLANEYGVTNASIAKIHLQKSWRE